MSRSSFRPQDKKRIVTDQRPRKPRSGNTQHCLPKPVDMARFPEVLRYVRVMFRAHVIAHLRDTPMSIQREAHAGPAAACRRQSHMHVA